MPAGGRTEAERGRVSQDKIWRKAIDDELKTSLAWHKSYWYMLDPKDRMLGPAFTGAPEEEVPVEKLTRPQSSPSVVASSSSLCAGSLAGSDHQVTSKRPKTVGSSAASGIGGADLLLPDWTQVAKARSSAGRRKPSRPSSRPSSSPALKMERSSEEALLELAKASPPRIRAKIQASLPPKMKIPRPLTSAHDVGWLPNVEKRSHGTVNVYPMIRHPNIWPLRANAYYYEKH